MRHGSDEGRCYRRREAQDGVVAEKSSLIELAVAQQIGFVRIFHLFDVVVEMLHIQQTQAVGRPFQQLQNTTSQKNN